MARQQLHTDNSPTHIRRAHLEVRGNLKKFFEDTKSREIVLDGPAGTGKTRVALERQHLIQCKYSGSRGLIVRKYRSSMNETCLQVLNHDVYKDGEGDFQDRPLWRERDQKYVYDNGSEIIVAGMDDPTKVMSSQYDWAYWNEAIEGKQAEWEMIMSRLRNGVVPYQQMIGDTNPGPPTHWIKQREKDGKLSLYPTNHKDNPVYWDRRRNKWTQRGDSYVNGILRDSLTGNARVRLYDGLWRAAEGLVYDTFDPDVHIVDRHDVPRHWPRYWAFDFGYVDPFVWQEWVEDINGERYPAGSMILHRELYHTSMIVSECAKFIKERSYGINPMALICDWDAEDRATLEKELGMLTVQAFKFISPGIGGVQRRFHPDNPRFGRKPGLYIMGNANLKTDPKLKSRHKPTCTAEEFGVYSWDTGKIDLDKYKDAPIDKDNHGMDTTRYAVAFVDDVAIDPQTEEHIVGYDELYGDDEEDTDFRQWSHISDL